MVDDAHRESHVPPKLRAQVYDLCNAIGACLDQSPRLAIPALVLVYAAIDGMAWVSIADGRDDVNGLDFQAWAKSYLLPDSGLDCDEADLWAARCGLVHGQVMDSRIARAGKARHVWYYVGPGNRYLMPLHEQSREMPTTLHIDVLVVAFHRAIDRFFDAIEREPELQRVVWARVNRYFDDVRAHGRPGGEGSWVETVPAVFDN